MPLSAQHFDEVGTLLREVAAEVIAPRFRTLVAGEIEEKSPGELVTVVDREAERRLSARLPALLAGSRVIGEEATASDPRLLEGLDQGDVWLVDPLDGTSNFIDGKACFAVMVALLSAGAPVCSWMLEPVTDRLHRAQRGAGAESNGVRVRTARDEPVVEALRGAVLTKYLPPQLKARVAPGCLRLAEVSPGKRCAGAEYPAIVAAEQDFALFYRTLPWDHAPGVLFLVEAGGVALRYDGRPYVPGDGGTGLLVARNRAIWLRTQRTLLADMYRVELSV